MRRSINGPRSASTAASLAIKQGSMARRAASTDENNINQNVRGEKSFMDQARHGFSATGPVTARLNALENRYSHILEMQAKFLIMDKWIQQQFGLKLFPPSVVNCEKFPQGNPDDVDNPFYALYLVIQRTKLLEEKVKKLESRPMMDEYFEPRPTSNYSSAHAFRNYKGKPGAVSGGVKRTYGSSPSTTPKKAKLIPRPAPQSSNYPFKPSVKILPKDPNIPSPMKKDSPSKENGQNKPDKKEASPVKQGQETPTKPEINISDSATQAKEDKEEQTESVALNNSIVTQDNSTEEKHDIDLLNASNNADSEGVAANSASITEKARPSNKETVDADEDVKVKDIQEVNPLPSFDNNVADAKNDGNNEETDQQVNTEIKLEVLEQEENVDDNEDEEIPILEDSTAPPDNVDMGGDSGQDDEEVDQKPLIPMEEDVGGGDVSGSEASVSSLNSSSGRPRLSTRRQAAAAATSSSTNAEDEKPIMYTARGRRHTVPRRYAEFTGHDNVVSILKSQQRAEKSAAASGSNGGGKPGRKPGSSRNQDTPPKIKKMVKTTYKTQSPKKQQFVQQDSDVEGETVSPTKKKAGPNVVLSEKPPCVDELVERVMAREVDADGMVQLTESFPNIYVNQQQLVAVIIRSNGKATRLTRKMTTLVFEDSVLASASPFGTKYYKDRLPPEPLEAMVDFIADSGFEPHYTKKKIYMIVGQVCNEARAGRVSRKFMQPMEGNPTAGSSEETPLPPEMEEYDGTLPLSPTVEEEQDQYNQ